MAASQGAHIPGEEDDVEPEFQVAPMVDVLLVLLLFFMATATTDIVAQVADLVLPDAKDAKEKDKEAKSLVVNIEKLNWRIKINGVHYDTPKEIIPIIVQARDAAVTLSGIRPEDFRVLIRADVQAPFGVVSDVLEAAAGGAKVPNVTFAVNEKKAAGGGESKDSE